MFDTEKFISEVQRRLCLWDPNSEDYNNKIVRQSAWSEIAELFFDDWCNLPFDDKDSIIRDLQRKWKGMRDYYARERNKEKTASGKKRCAPILTMLTFLGPIMQSTDNSQHKAIGQIKMEYASAPSASKAEDPIHTEYWRESPDNSNDRTRTPTSSEQVNSSSDINKIAESDANLSFLMAILPDMKSMNEKQNFDFRLEVMNLIKKIKYEDNKNKFGT